MAGGIPEDAPDIPGMVDWGVAYTRWGSNRLVRRFNDQYKPNKIHGDTSAFDITIAP